MSAVLREASGCQRHPPQHDLCEASSMDVRQGLALARLSAGSGIG